MYAVALAPGAYGKHPREEIEAAWSHSREILRSGKGKGDYILGKFPNGSLEHSWETVGFVDDLVRSYDIDTVVTHHYGEAHQDHLAAQRIAVSASRRHVDRLWLWESSIYTHRNVFPFRPQVYVPVSTDAFEGKMDALEAYLRVRLLESDEVDAHRGLARYRGAEMQRDYAEAFELVWDVRDG